MRFFCSSRRRHTRYWRDWSSDVCSSDLIGRSSELIEFRDAKTGQVINSDERPMMHDATGARASSLFDPKAGEYIAVAKKLGFSEHFYGLGEKAARLDKRRSEFVNWNSDTPGYTEGKDPIYKTVH